MKAPRITDNNELQPGEKQSPKSLARNSIHPRGNQPFCLAVLVASGNTKPHAQTSPARGASTQRVAFGPEGCGHVRRVGDVQGTAPEPVWHGRQPRVPSCHPPAQPELPPRGGWRMSGNPGTGPGSTKAGKPGHMGALLLGTARREPGGPGHGCVARAGAIFGSGRSRREMSATSPNAGEVWGAGGEDRSTACR